jgi:phosphopentomutase
MKAVLIVLDSVGIGWAPDAAEYGDEGAATLQHTARAVGGLRLPVLQQLGLGNIPGLLPPDRGAIEGVPPVPAPLASWGALRERSQGKDTITGHWEIGGLELRPGFHLFPVGPPSFPPEILLPLARETGRPLLGNRHGSGTAIIEELGAEALRRGALICYTSADSVFQIAAHLDAVPLAELYRACEIARRLCDPYRVGRVIARPFRGEPGRFRRTPERRDYAFQPAEPTLLERLHRADVPVHAVGKIDDIFAHRGLSSSQHTGDNAASQNATFALAAGLDHGFVFANFIDFDMLYGHRRDPAGYAACLERTDTWLESFLPLFHPGDLLLITADHGNDPTFPGTDHTREYVPLLVYSPGRAGQSLGVRDGFYDIAASLLEAFHVAPPPRGVSFLPGDTP